MNIVIPQIPRSWLIALLGLCLVGLRAMGIDSFTTAGIGMIVGYLTGQHLPQNSSTQATSVASVANGVKQ